MFVTPPKYVDHAKARFKEMEPEQFDRRMWQACRAINLIDDVATLFSCTGHPENDNRQFYVTLITSTPAGERRIDELYRHWCNLLGTHLPEEAGSTPTHHFTSVYLHRIEDPHGVDGDVIWVRNLQTLVDDKYNTPHRVTNALQLAANRVVY